MPTLDPRFIVTSDLESLFRDKDTGLPLASGLVYFFSNTNRSDLKPVYQLTENGSDLTYNPLPNPCVLSSVGTFQDALGNNIVPYYYPFQGTPEDNKGVQELYYIKVLSSGNVEQFDRIAWPNISNEESPLQNDNIPNFIANGQFIVHNTIPGNPLNNIPDGTITQPSTEIAQGGWSFFLPTNTVIGTYNVTFVQLQPLGGITGDYPRFAVDMKFDTTGATYCSLFVKWPNVNQFNSPNGRQKLFTLHFSALCTTGTQQVFIYYRKYFGQGGSPTPAPAILGSITIESDQFQNYILQGLYFGDNSLPPNNNVGPLGDDYIVLEFRFQNSNNEVQITNFVLAEGTLPITSFPETTNAEMLTQSLNGYLPTPKPDGSDLYLPLVVTTTGTAVDRSSLGSIVAKLNPRAIGNELPCDGAVYPVSGYSPLGIPYSRLFNEVLFIPSLNMSLFGSGPTFASVTFVANVFSITYTNSNGTIPVDSVSSPTGIVFGGLPYTFTGTVNAVPPAGSYFTMNPNSITYTVWYTVNGVGTAPTSPNLIKVAVQSTDSTTVVAQLTAKAINSVYFAVPNLNSNSAFGNRGLFLRGTSIAPTNPPTVGQLGSYQNDAFPAHNHSPATVAMGEFLAQPGPGTAWGPLAPFTNVGLSLATNGSGNETVPVNMRVYWYIKY